MKVSVLTSVVVIAFLSILGGAEVEAGEKKTGEKKTGEKKSEVNAVKDETKKTDSKELTEQTFDEFIKTHDFVLVEFYTTWCSHCKNFKTEWDKAATKLMETMNIPLMTVDADANKELATTYNIAGYPTVLAFFDGERVEYKGGKTAEEITKWVALMTSDIVVAETSEPIADLMKDAQTGFIGSFKSNTSEEYKAFESVFSKNRQHGKFVANFSPSNKNTVKVYRKDEGFGEEVEIVSKEQLEQLCEVERFPYFGPIGSDNYDDYARNPRFLVWYCGSEKNYKDQRKLITEAAKVTRNEYNFVWLDTDMFGQFAENMLGASTYPGIILMRGDARYIYPGTLETLEKSEPIQQFLEDVKSGKIERSFKSQEIPESNDEPVKVVVGKTFNSTVLREDADVFLEIYADWCSHCKKFAPIYEEFAKKMSTRKNLVVAKMDGTKNESPNSEFQWSSFPSIMFVKAGTTKPIPYGGQRSMKELEEFLEQHGTPYEAQGAEEKDEL